MRKSEVNRQTKETNITCYLNLDGSAKANINSGIGFFDHMLTAFSKHSSFDLEFKATGDLVVDTHHTVEDSGIVLADAFNKALNDKNSIERYQTFIMPMDDALVLTSVDICGRGYYASNVEFKCDRVGDFETQTVDEFFRSFAINAKLNLHFYIFRGENAHHIIEAMFKGLGKCLKDAVKIRSDNSGILSTKGVL